MSQPPDDSLIPWEWSWENFRRDVFQLVAWGYQIAETEIRQHHLEEHITGLLRKAIRQKLDDMTLPPRFELYTPMNEDPEDDDNVFGKDRPIVDISIESGSRPRQRYRLEGKRCATSVNPISWYVKGIYPYIKREYAREAPEAGLIGLVQSSTPVYWRSQLRVKTQTDVTLNCEAHPVDADIIPDLAVMSMSVHRRTDNSFITLYHVFLDCKKP